MTNYGFQIWNLNFNNYILVSIFLIFWCLKTSFLKFCFQIDFFKIQQFRSFKKFRFPNSCYTLLIEGILVLSIRVGCLKILIWDNRWFLGGIWLARNSKTFELCLSVHPSEGPSANSYELQTLQIGFNKPYANTSNINQTGIPGSWAHGKSDSHQIWYLN